jgi:hypothetical protein
MAYQPPGGAQYLRYEQLSNEGEGFMSLPGPRATPSASPPWSASTNLLTNHAASNKEYPLSPIIPVRPLPDNAHEIMNPGHPVFVIEGIKDVYGTDYVVMPIWALNFWLHQAALDNYTKENQGGNLTLLGKRKMNQDEWLSKFPLTLSDVQHKISYFGTLTSTLRKLNGGAITGGFNDRYYYGLGTSEIDSVAVSGRVDNVCNMWPGGQQSETVGFGAVMTHGMYNSENIGIRGERLGTSPFDLEYLQILPFIKKNRYDWEPTVNHRLNPEDYVFDNFDSITYTTKRVRPKTGKRMIMDETSGQARLFTAEDSYLKSFMDFTTIKTDSTFEEMYIPTPQSFHVWTMGTIEIPAPNNPSIETITHALRIATRMDTLKSSSRLTLNLLVDKQ